MFNFKSKLIAAAFAFLGIAAFMGCSKNDETGKSIQQDLPSAQDVGKVHNASLDFVLIQLKQDNFKSNANEQALKDSVISYTKSYLISNEGVTESEITEINEMIGIASDTLDISQLLSSVTDDNYRNMLTDIIDIFNSETPLSYSELDNVLNLIELDAVASSYYNEILAITSVARYSYIYWEQEMDNWVFLFNGNNKSVNVDPRFWDILGADAQGAVGGAIGGGLVGALIGAPFASGIQGIVVALQAK